LKIPASGFDLISLKTEKFNSELDIYKFACYNDGSFFYTSSNLSSVNNIRNETSINFFKPILNDPHNKPFKFIQIVEENFSFSKSRDNKMNINIILLVFIGTNGHIYILKENKKDMSEFNFVEIKGKFDYAHISSVMKGKCNDITAEFEQLNNNLEINIEIIGFCKGQLKFYKIILNHDNYEVLNLKNFFAHFDYTTFMYQKGVILLKFFILIIFQKIKF
jgi:hypothetical protein